MAAAEEFQALSETVFHWSVYEPSVKCDLCCTAVRVTSGFVVIDPIPLAPEAGREFVEIAPIRAILLTNANHVRHAESLRREHQVPIVTMPSTRKQMTELKPDVALLEHERLYGITPISIPGASSGETAFYSAAAGLVVLGDAVLNLGTEIGLELLPDKYSENPEQNRASLRKLLSLDFHLLTFAHGTPLTAHAKERLAALLT
jgi:glyoxylase-like metal-dependent hydrolase (beta-lactamase superfamily II)